jgi:hypothetical protein
LRNKVVPSIARKATRYGIDFYPISIFWRKNLMRNIVTGLVLIGLLTACSSSGEDNSGENQQHKALYNSVNQPLDQAKGVEQQILEGAEERRRHAEGL